MLNIVKSKCFLYNYIMLINKFRAKNKLFQIIKKNVYKVFNEVNYSIYK